MYNFVVHSNEIPSRKMWRVVVRTGTGEDATQMLVHGGKHGRGATRYTGTK